MQVVRGGKLGPTPMLRPSAESLAWDHPDLIASPVAAMLQFPTLRQCQTKFPVDSGSTTCSQQSSYLIKGPSMSLGNRMVTTCSSKVAGIPEAVDSVSTSSSAFSNSCVSSMFSASSGVTGLTLRTSSGMPHWTRVATMSSLVPWRIPPQVSSSSWFL